MDLNADGVNDLAVSAPTVGAKDLRYQVSMMSMVPQISGEYDEYGTVLPN